MPSNNLSECARVRALIGPNVGPQETTSQAQDAYAHLNNCHSCQTFYEQQNQVVNRLREISAKQNAPPRIRDAVMASLDTELATPAGQKRFGAWPAVGGLVAAAAALAIWIGVRPPAEQDGLMGTTVAAAVRTAPTSDSMSTTESAPLRLWFQTHDVPDFEIPAIENAQLTGGRVIQVGGYRGAAVEFMKDGRRLTYVMAPVEEWLSELNPEDIVTVNSEGLEVAIWEEDGSTRAVLSSMPRRQLLEIAEQCKYKRIL